MKDLRIKLLEELFLIYEKTVLIYHCISVCKNIKVLENNTAISYILAAVRKNLRNQVNTTKIQNKKNKKGVNTSLQ